MILPINWEDIYIYDAHNYTSKYIVVIIDVEYNQLSRCKLLPSGKTGFFLSGKKHVIHLR